MSEGENRENFAERRGRLIADIARQRGQLAEAYRNLEKPIHYAEYGMRGFGFFRRNPWVFAAVPAVFSVASTLLGLRKKNSSQPAPRQRQSVDRQPKSFAGHALKWGGHGWRLFRFYRRLRTYFP
jgi:hypothetical protein